MYFAVGIIPVTLGLLGARLLPGLGGQRSALASLLAGVLVYSAGAHVLQLDHPYLLSLACALAAYVTVACSFEPAVAAEQR